MNLSLRCTGVVFLVVMCFPALHSNLISTVQQPIRIATTELTVWRTSSGQSGVVSQDSKENKLKWKVKSKSAQGDLFRILNEDDQTFASNVSCHTTEEAAHDLVSVPTTFLRSSFRPKVSVYLEVDYRAFLDNQADVQLTLDWITSLFAHVKDIFAIHDVNIYISEVFIWDTPDPYNTDHNPSDLLDRFAQRMQYGFDGHVAQLCSTRALGGGKAVLSGLCQEYNTQPLEGPYSVATALSIDPISGFQYNWSVYLMAHELGHLLGSPHTHACFWGANNDQAIDNCFMPEGVCTAPGTSQVPGGVMSYCYLRSRGVDFNRGLGDEPGAYVFNSLMNSTCIDNSCVGLACDDGDNCTTGDRYDSQCDCIGTLIDLNQNLLCDLQEACEEDIVIDDFAQDSIAYLASNTILFNDHDGDQPDHMILSARTSISISPGVSIPTATIFEVYTIGCDEN